MGGSRIGSEVVLALTEAAALRGGTWYVLAGDEGDVWRLSLSIVPRWVCWAETTTAWSRPPPRRRRPCRRL